MPLVARFFDLRLLSLMGYQPQLFQCIECHEALEPVTNYYSLVDGGVLCPSHGEGRVGAEPLPLPLFKALRFLQTRDWDVVARLDLSDGLHAELERLLQSTPHLSPGTKFAVRSVFADQCARGEEQVAGGKWQILTSDFWALVYELQGYESEMKRLWRVGLLLVITTAVLAGCSGGVSKQAESKATGAPYELDGPLTVRAYDNDRVVEADSDETFDFLVVNNTSQSLPVVFVSRAQRRPALAHLALRG